MEPILGVTFGWNSRRTHMQPADAQATGNTPHVQLGYDPTNPLNHPFGKGYKPPEDGASFQNGAAGFVGGSTSRGQPGGPKNPLADYKVQVGVEGRGQSRVGQPREGAGGRERDAWHERLITQGPFCLAAGRPPQAQPTLLVFLGSRLVPGVPLLWRARSVQARPRCARALCAGAAMSNRAHAETPI